MTRNERKSPFRTQWPLLHVYIRNVDLLLRHTWNSHINSISLLYVMTIDAIHSNKSSGRCIFFFALIIIIIIFFFSVDLKTLNHRMRLSAIIRDDTMKSAHCPGYCILTSYEMLKRSLEVATPMDIIIYYHYKLPCAGTHKTT